MGHLIIAIYIAALLLGAGATLLIGRLRRTDPAPFLKPLFGFALFFTLVILTVLLTNYAQTNIGVPYERHTPPIVLWVLANNFGGFIAFSGLLFTFPAVFQGFLGRRPSRLLNRVLSVVVAAFAIGYIAGFVLFLVRIPSLWLETARNTFNGLAVLFLLGTTVFFRLRPQKAPFVIARAAVRLFNGLYLAVFGLFPLVFLVPGPYQMLYLAIEMMGASGVLWLWLSLGYAKWRRAHAGEIISQSEIDQLAADTGLSAREKDVLTYLLEGRSNAEIARDLFLSVGTVKNHVTSIFRKMGIARRSQLLGYLRGVRRPRLDEDA